MIKIIEAEIFVNNVPPVLTIKFRNNMPTQSAIKGDHFDQAGNLCPLAIVIPLFPIRWIKTFGSYEEWFHV